VTTLVFVPTELERNHLAGQPGFGDLEGRCELVGFGPVASAARASYLIGRRRPDRVVLAGIAGTYDPTRLDLGQAAVFSRVHLDGVGAGEGQAFQSAASLGFPQWHDPGNPDEAIGDELELAGPDGLPGHALVTCCAASGGAEDVGRRRHRYPGAVAEDMEGFAVACACHMGGVPLAVVRGISNLAGDRRVDRWQIDEALQAAWGLVRRLDASPAWGRAA